MFIFTLLKIVNIALGMNHWQILLHIGIGDKDTGRLCLGTLLNFFYE